MLGLLKAKVEPYLLLIKVVGVLLIVGSLAGYYLWSQSKISGLEADVSEQKVTINNYKHELSKVADINKAQKQALDLIEKDQKAQAEVRRLLMDQKGLTTAQTDLLLTQISKMDAKLDGPVAPVLKETIKTIQNMNMEEPK